jgi:FAD/FMN-containing dehydrogenase
MEAVTVRANGGTTVMLDEDALENFDNSLRGTLLQPEDAGYDAARQVWNGMIDRRPDLIVSCAGVSDVVNSVNLARGNGLKLAVRGGGHSVAGHCVCDGGLMIDLSPMKSVRVDPAQKTARAEAGAKWIDFDMETQAFGLATTGGTNSDTGIAGLTLGGGLGWLAGKYGLTCDNLLSADVVTADGRFLTASADENADLFWGLRGGGGNFGVVTSFEYQLHEVDIVLAGMLAWPIDRAKELLSFYAEYSPHIPDELNTITIMLTLPDGPPAVATALCYNGPLDEGEEVLRPIREFGPPMVDHVGPMPYLAFQTAMDDSFPVGRQYYWKANFIKEIDEHAIDTSIEYFLKTPSKFTAVGFQQFGNAANRVDPDATAFSHRDALYDYVMLSGWEDPAEAEANIEWTRALYEDMRPSLHAGIYVNAVDEEASDIRSAFRDKTYERLVALKNKYDPTNLFRLNPNIEPTV